MIAWWYADNGKPAGPHDFEALERLFMVGTINAQTQVWHEGMAAWASISSVPELAGMRGPAAPAPSSAPMQALQQPYAAQMNQPAIGRQAAAPRQYEPQPGQPAAAYAPPQPAYITAAPAPQQGASALKVVGIVAGAVVMVVIVLVAGIVILAGKGAGSHPTMADGSPATQTQTAIIASTAAEPENSPEDALPVAQQTGETPSASGSWLNPLTHAPAQLLLGWRGKTAPDKDGDDEYLFMSPDQRRLVRMFFVAGARGKPLRSLAEAVRTNAGKEMILLGDGVEFSIGGHAGWEIDGRLKGDSKDLLVHFQIVTTADGAGEMDTVRDVADREADADLEELSTRLWRTVF